MKLLKFIFFLCVATSITSCSDNETDAMPFVLSNANISGAYNISSLNVDVKSTSVIDVSGVPVPITAASSTIGDTFDVEFILKADGTYTASGLYRTVTVITTAIEDEGEQTFSEIKSITASGTFTLNTTDAQITFFSALDNFLSGTFNILIFNETVLSLNQEKEEVDDATTAEINMSIRFIRE